MTSTDSSTSGYISRMQARSIIASIANRTRPGPGVQNEILLGRIESVLNLPKPPAPTELMFDASGTGSYIICWINNAPIVLDTLIELNSGSGWVTYEHGPLLDPSSAILTGITGAVLVRVSTIGPGNIASDPSNIVFIIVNLNQNIPAPTGLTNVNAGVGYRYGDFRLSWTNNAPNMIDTIIEINGTLYNPNRYDPNGPFYGVPPDLVTTWPVYTHAPLGNATTIVVSGYEILEPRIYSVTTAGISNVAYLAINGT